MRFVIGTHGWNYITCIDCVNKACLGLLLGFVFKYLGNIHKLFMFGASMFFIAGLSIGQGMVADAVPGASTAWQPTLESVLGMFTILCSLILFNSTQLRDLLSSGGGKL